jgi:hypothetical protein
MGEGGEKVSVGGCLNFPNKAPKVGALFHAGLVSQRQPDKKVKEAGVGNGVILQINCASN